MGPRQSKYINVGPLLLTRFNFDASVYTMVLIRVCEKGLTMIF